MRLIGAVLIFSGCTGLGLWYREQLLGRIKMLRTMVAVLEMLMSEIRYGKSTLPECCREIATRVEEPFRGTLWQIGRDCQNESGVVFQEVFIKRMTETFEKTPLKREDRKIFLAPFYGQGFLDGQMQLRSIEQSLVQIKDTIRIQNEEQREKCRMAVGLGVMSGLLLIIIMV